MTRGEPSNAAGTLYEGSGMSPSDNLQEMHEILSAFSDPANFPELKMDERIGYNPLAIAKTFVDEFRSGVVMPTVIVVKDSAKFSPLMLRGDLDIIYTGTLERTEFARRLAAVISARHELDEAYIQERDEKVSSSVCISKRKYGIDC